MSSSKPFKFNFGAGAFPSPSSNNSTFTFGAGESTTFAPTGAVDERLVCSESVLAAANKEIARLGTELQAAHVAAKQSRTRESIARGALNATRHQLDKEVAKAVEAKLREMEQNPSARVTDLQHEVDGLKKQLADDYNKICDLQNQAFIDGRTIGEQKEEVAEAQHNRTVADKACDDANKQVESYKKQLLELRDTCDALRHEVSYEKASNKDLNNALTKAFADLEFSETTRSQLTQDKDGFEVEKHDAELRFQDLLKQWQDTQTRTEELEAELHQLESLDAVNQGLESDIERLTAIIADHERTLVVKDERIAHLEGQFQKERQRTLNAADSAHEVITTAATSPTTEGPLTFSTFGDSLQAELDAQSEDLEPSIYDPIELSDITFLVDITPHYPVTHNLSVCVIDAASTSPSQIPAPVLTIAVNEAGSIIPTPSSINTSNASIQTESPELQFSAVVSASVFPTEPSITTADASAQTESSKLDLSVVASTSVAPVEATALPSTLTLTPMTVTHHVQPIGVRVVSTASTATQASVLTASTETQTSLISTTGSETQTYPSSTTSSESQTPVSSASTNETQTSSISTASTGVQTSLTVIEPTIPIISSPKSVKSKNMSYFIYALVGLFLFTILKLYVELQAWRTANGVTFYYDTHTRGGAFGNGRYIFGFIPVGMDVGRSEFSEQVARYASMAITTFEMWAGISHEPHY